MTNYPNPTDADLPAVPSNVMQIALLKYPSNLDHTYTQYNILNSLPHTVYMFDDFIPIISNNSVCDILKVEIVTIPMYSGMASFKINNNQVFLSSLASNAVG